ncbi:PhzF family phenazine biosynthesis protein [Pontivivens ytuae]|uniref:PhzF family phenazine biosynthesis protein n=1 Tax=Pontivivens ytuae TaxID=2789856 RepID=A0A7S9QC89_9RHOB|nr:PhzF family phenazine biosynthesis protein [Pontivivens ytuae]QPH53570.1 PhzF family phenazine biosynthesis protein [Pontivivens ytuae]
MASYDCDWVDAFTDRAFGGNGCVVVHGAGDMALEDRLALVRETSLSECAYLVPSDTADFGARYYLPTREIPLAGHPTVATVASLMHRGKVAAGDRFTLEVGAGVLPIHIHADGWIEMTQPAPTFGPTFAPERIAAIYGLAAEEVVGAPQVVSTGTPFCVTLLRSLDAVRRAQLDREALAAWQADSGQGQMEPYLVCLEGVDGGDTFARLLMLPPEQDEDPFTGSATGCAASWLWHHGHLATPDYVAEQGHGLGRPGRARVSVLGPREAIEGVRVAGQAHVLMSGVLHI